MEYLTVTAIRKTYHKCCTIFCVKVQKKRMHKADKTQKNKEEEYKNFIECLWRNVFCFNN